MFQTQLINQVLEWERRLEIEEEKRKNSRCIPDRYLSTESQPSRKERQSIFARIFRLGRDRPPGDVCYQQEQCRKTQPG